MSKKPMENQNQTEVVLKKEDRDLLQSVIKEIQEERAAKAAEETHVHHDSPSPVQTAVQSQQEPKKQLESGLDHYRNCPTCHKTINEEAKKELEPEFLKEFTQKQHEKVKSLKNPVICEGCGDVIDREEPNCPTCHGTKARKFSA